MATKRRLTPNEWQRIRERWESDPRPGYQWVVEELSLTVTLQAVAIRSKRDGWAKQLSLKKIVERAQRQADGVFVTAAVDGVPSGGFVDGSTKADDTAAVDVRAAVIERHRADWREFRLTFPLEVMGASLENARKAKVSVEVLRLLHGGERQAWGLDALLEDTSAGVSTEDEMLAHFEKMMKQTEEWKAQVAQREPLKLEQGGADAPAG